MRVKKSIPNLLAAFKRVKPLSAPKHQLRILQPKKTFWLKPLLIDSFAFGNKKQFYYKNKKLQKSLKPPTYGLSVRIAKVDRTAF